MKKIITIIMIVFATASAVNGRPGAISIKYDHIMGQDKQHDTFKIEDLKKSNNNSFIFEFVGTCK